MNLYSKSPSRSLYHLGGLLSKFDTECMTLVFNWVFLLLYILFNIILVV